MSTLRLILGLPIAALITFGLFVLMGGLIKQDLGVLPAAKPQVRPVFLPEKTPPPPKSPNTVIDDLPDAPPPPKVTPTRVTKVDTGTFQPPKPTVRPAGDGSTIGVKGTPFPIVTLPPVYPARCQSAGIEGTATVQFDVTHSGEVVNIRVVSSSNRCFEASAKKAIAGYKYTPSLGGGSGIAIYGVVKTFRFTLN